MPLLQGDPQAVAFLGRTVERFVSTPSDPPYADTPDVEEALRLAFQDLQAVAPPFVSGSELLDQTRRTLALPLGCDTIDALLQGGVRQGQVLEIFGDTASGKTQLCLMAAATTAARNERVVYIDTSNAFAPMRLAAMLLGIPTRAHAVDALLSNVSVVRAYAAHAVIAALDDLLRQAAGQHTADGQLRQQPHQQEQEVQRPAPLRLVILDSIGAVTAPVLGGGGQHSRGHVLLASMASALKALAQELGAGVLVTNHLVGGGGGGDGTRRERRAALGESWANQAHVRLQLAPPPCDGAAFTATLQASTLSPPGGTARYWLTDAGVVGTPPTTQHQQHQ